MRADWRRIARVAPVLALATVLSCDGATEPAVVASVIVVPFTTQILVGPGGGQTLQLEAIARSSNGNAISGVPITWYSDRPSIASVNQAGVVTAVSTGAAVISAYAGTISGAAIIQVADVPAGAFTLPDDSVSLEVGPVGAGTHQLAGVLADSGGVPITNRQIFWSSTASGIARVSNDGLITAVAPGEAKIIAGREGRLDSAVVTVTEVDTLPDDADVQVADAQWTQGVQRDDGSLPLIRGGRASVLNVLLTATRSIATPSVVALRLRDGGGAVVWTAHTDVLVPTGVPPSMASPTAQFLVPNVELVPGRSWEVIRDPDGLLADNSTADDLFPRAGPTPLVIVDVPPLRIRLVPIALTAHAGVTPVVTPDLIEQYIRTVRALHPHGAIDVAIADPYSSPQSFGVAPNGGSSTFWIALLNELDAARVADASFADSYWIGVVAPPPGFTFVTFGGFGYIPPDGASFGPFTRTSTLVRLGYFAREAQTRELVAHELGHNFGRFHAPCGAAAGPDPSYPVAGGTVGPGGHDVDGWATGVLTAADPISPSTGDLMGYCVPIWISRYTYGGILAFRGSGAAATRAAPERRRVLVVRGHVEDGEVRLDTAFVSHAPATADDPAGEVSVEAVGEDGATLVSQRVRLGRYDHAPGIEPFAAYFPVDDALDLSIRTLRARIPTGEARKVR